MNSPILREKVNILLNNKLERYIEYDMSIKI